MYAKHNATLRINNNVIEFGKYNFDWRFVSTDDDQPDFLMVKIFNLSNQFLNSIDSLAPAIFEFSRKDLVDTLVLGYVQAISSKKTNSATKETTIKIMKINSNGFNDVSLSLKGELKSSEVIEKISSKLGIQVKQLELKNDITHYNGYVVKDKGINAMRKLAENCGSKVELNGENLYIYDQEKDKKSNVTVLNYNSGLLNEPEPYSEKGKLYNYKVKSLALPNVRKNSVLRIKSRYIDTYAKVLKYEINNFIAEYTVGVLEV